MVTIIFKTLEKCVSNCVYCDVIKRKQSKVMSYELLEIVFNRINTFLEQNPTEEVAITWHGGEITMLGEEYFLKAFEFQEKLCKNTKNRIKHNAQSNLLVLNQGIIDALRKLGINSIGTSFDPIPGIRGLGKNRNSTLYNTCFFNSTELLKRNNMSWGIINVVHKKQLSVAKDVYYYLTNLCDSVCFNEIYVYGEDTYGLRISGEEFADFLGEIFPLWLKHKDKINVRPFNSLFDLAMGNSGNLVCEFSGNCSHRWLYISPLGETSHCGKAGDYDLISYGNIAETELQDIINNIQRQKFVDRLGYLQNNDCKGCRFWGICHGGCFVDSLMKNNDLNTISSSCVWIKRFIEKYLEPILGVKVNFL